jgi:hypothetical protein
MLCAETSMYEAIVLRSSCALATTGSAEALKAAFSAL